MPTLSQQAGAGPLTPPQISAIFQGVTLTALNIDPDTDKFAYARVRVTWPTAGQPDWKIEDDVCFISCAEQDDPYNRVRDVKTSPNDDTSVQQETTYTRVWNVGFTFYGPESFERARLVKSALLDGAAHDELAKSNLFLVTNTTAPQRVPELFQGRWWERVDFSARFNELVSEQRIIPTVASAEVVLNTRNGQEADINLKR